MLCFFDVFRAAERDERIWFGLQTIVVYEDHFLRFQASQTRTLNPTITKSPLICSDRMQFCTRPRALYGAGLSLCIRRSLVWFTLQNSCWLRCTSQRDSWGPPISQLLQRFLAGTCGVHPVIVFDSSLVLHSAEAEGRGGGGG